MKFQRSHRIFLLGLIFFSLLFSSCNLSSGISETAITPLDIEIKATPTRAFISARIPQEYFPAKEFSGYYTASFEVSSFVPCSENDLPGYGKGYWIDVFQSPSFQDQYNELITETGQNTNQGEEADTIVFVHFIGKLSNPASIEDHHGHMGQYKQEIMVTELIEMKAVEENQCPSA